jgi:hypothetical protein
MNPPNSSSRRRTQAQPRAEALESRSLLTGGTGNTLAIIPATISQPGGTAVVSFTIDPKLFTAPKGAFALGIDVAPAGSSTVQPYIKSVNNPQNQIIPQAFHSIYNPHLSHGAVARGVGTRAVLTPVVVDPTKTLTYSVTIQGQNHTSGNVLVGFYLPGDATGDGVVDQSDIAAIKAALHSRAGQNNYNFDADANRDGRIGSIDLAYAEQNLGVSTTVSPVISANLNAYTGGGVWGNSTVNTTAQYTGSTTPNATITYHEANGLVPDNTTTADGSGNYTITVPLARGSNTFQVSSTDGFGQTITGSIQPIISSTTAFNFAPYMTATTNVPAQGTSPSGSTTGAAKTTG